MAVILTLADRTGLQKQKQALQAFIYFNNKQLVFSLL